VKVTEDAGGDEPYMWILGFKVDADTIGPPPAGSLLPTLGVQVFEGGPHFRHVVGPNSVDAPAVLPIPPALGTRSFRLRPAQLPLVGWFPGIAGLICLLWDEDGFAPATSEAGFKVFKTKFGPALSAELTKLINGGYDDPLSRNANGIVLPDPPAGRDLTWRLARLRDAGGRKNAIRAIKDEIVGSLKGAIKDAFVDEANWDELIDPDDLLGAEVQAFLGDELGPARDFTMDFTDDEANYTARGRVWSTPVRGGSIQAIVSNVTREWDDAQPVWLRVCFHEAQTYYVRAFRQIMTTHFQLQTVGPDPVTEVRWFLNGTRLPAGAFATQVIFEPVSVMEAPPEDVMAPNYPGGPGTLRSQAAGSALDITNDHANGVFFGQIRALFSFPGDPPLTDEITSGYDRTSELTVIAVDLSMDQEYVEHVQECKKIVDWVNRKRIPVNWGKWKVDPGDPPPLRLALEERAQAAADVASEAGLQIANRSVGQALISSVRLRRHHG